MSTEKTWNRNGLACMVRTHDTLLHRCGYAEIPAGHPMHGKGYDDLPDEWHKCVHGGLTFSDMIEGKWFAGFDCAHLGDLPDRSLAKTEEVLAIAERLARIQGEGHVWTRQEVERQANELADLIAQSAR